MLLSLGTVAFRDVATVSEATHFDSFYNDRKSLELIFSLLVIDSDNLITIFLNV